MAITVEFPTATGFTDLKLYLVPHGNYVLANPGGDSCTERVISGIITGIYWATVDEALTGLHYAIVLDSSGTLIASYHVDLDVVAGIYLCGDWFYANLVESSTAVNSAIAAAVASEASAEIASAVAEELVAKHPAVGSIAQTLSAIIVALQDIVDFAVLTGDIAVTVQVVDDNDGPIESATVSGYQNGVLIKRVTTAADGSALIPLNAGSNTLITTATGFMSEVTPITVIADMAAVEIQLAPIVLAPPADPAFATLAIRCWGTDGVVKSGVAVNVQVHESPTGQGEQFSDAIVTNTSGIDGYATFTVPRGCAVKHWVGTNEPYFTSISTEDSIVYVDNFVGHDT